MSIRARVLIAVALAAAGAATGACTDPLQLSSTAQGVIVSPLSKDFGSSPVGVEVGPTQFIVSSGAGSDTVLAITSCPDFRVDLVGNTLPYDIYKICNDTGGGPTPLICTSWDIQSLSFDVYFRPSVATTEGCNLVIDFQTAADKVVALSGTGTAPPIDITLVQPPGGSIDFGDVLVGQTSATSTITVRSDGGSPLDITAAAASGAGFAETSGTAPITLTQSQTADYGVTCTPPAAGVSTGAFTITSTDPDEGTTTVSLRCNGIQSALTISPSPATLPVTRVGESSDLAIDLTNTGGAPLMIESVSIAGDGLAITQQPGNLMLAASGGTTQLRVGFTPTADGDVNGMLTVVFDGGQTRQLAVIGQGRVATLSVAPSGDIDFGPICVGQTVTNNFVALDTGTGGFVIESVALAGAGFVLTPLAPTTYPATVAPLGGSTVTFSVGVSPDTAGDIDASVAIDTDIPGRPTETIGLHALGLSGGTSATPSELDVGAAVIGDSSGAHLVTLSNCEADALDIVTFTITGVDAGDFAFVTAPVFTQIQPGSSASWSIELRPTSTGPKTATFHIEHSRGVVDIPLTGDGLDPDGHAGGDQTRGSYYACATSRDGAGGAGAIVIALAVAIAARRRRRS